MRDGSPDGPFEEGINHLDLTEAHRRAARIERGLHPLSNQNLTELINGLKELLAENGTKRSLTQLTSHAFLITNVLIEQDRKKPKGHLRKEVISDEEDPGLAPRLIEYGLGLTLQSNNPTSEEHSFEEIADYLLAIQNWFGRRPDEYPQSFSKDQRLKYTAAHTLLFRQLTSQRYVDGRQHLEKAYRAYKPFDTIMDDLLGFNIEDVIYYQNKIAELTIERAYEAGVEQLQNTESLLKIQGKVLEIAERDLWVDKQTLFNQCDSSNRFTNFLKRLSTSPGEVREFRYPYDLNPLRIHPIIEYNDKFLLSAPGLLSFSIAHTFYYDLIGTEVGGEFGDTLGTYLEDWTRECLTKIFPSTEIHTNVSYPIEDSYGESDVVIFHNNTMIVMECKSKKLKLETQKGEFGGLGAIESDLADSVGEGYNQADRLIEGILDGRIDELTSSEGYDISVSVDEYNEYLRCIVLGESFDSMATQDFARFLNFDPLPFVLDIFDLQVITHVLENPAAFVAYVKQRINLTDRQTSRGQYYYYPTDIHSPDEIDYLGFFIQQDMEFPAVHRDIMGAGDTLRDEAVTEMLKNGEMRYFYEN